MHKDKIDKTFSFMPNLKTKSCLKLMFKTREPICRRQVVNLRSQTPQEQSVAKPGTPPQYILADYMNLT